MTGCPCQRAEQCAFVVGDREREFLGFFYPGDQPIDSMPLHLLSDMAWVPPERTDVLCAAHAAGVRVVLNAGDVAAALADDPPGARKQWIDSKVDLARRYFYDGINFDYEEAAQMFSDLSYNYTALVRQTSVAFKKLNPAAQITVDVPWAPFGNDGRDYDYVGLGAAADRLLVMSYDMQAQIYGRCAAAANSPLPLIAKGLQQYLDLRIPPAKLLLGVAWYGYVYPCEPDAQGRPPSPRTDVCLLPPTEYRGAPCSDAAGQQWDYKQVMGLLRSGRNTTAPLWDPLGQSPRFNARLPGQEGIVQVWHESPSSLALRYALAARLGLRGVGSWNLGCLDHGAGAEPEAAAEAEAMWEAVREYVEGEGAGAGVRVGAKAER
ncbi:hypothetical protein HYH03_002592 [Edaphochlamys debaryana]|uniref:GH18 domain-containing protein n=1 Tax=Edaphochlamys debaryana TaxID=47281 RepID=A0A835YL23_9CHLO|nr:hypothetical protein HYH03_002592 [Edaphochlamys debaryana]|eukprot:KAG2499654.1 hypothetical protein HYH03_002592 [Edaphochlamys debaryana]